MSRHKVRFYFAYNSPYAFLANSRLERALTNVDVEVEYKPVYSPRSPGSPGPDSRKLRYLFEDVGRFAELYGLKLNPGPMADTRKACLGFLYARDCGRGKAYHDAVYRARFLDARDIGSEETLAEIAKDVGLDRQGFLNALSDTRFEAELAQSNEEAEKEEVFGFPFFIVGSQRFWGNDRIEWLVRELQKKP